MAEAVRLREFSIPPGQTLTVDCRRIESESLGWIAEAVGGVVEVEGSNAETPGASDWVPSKGEPSIAAGSTLQAAENAPIGWLRWRCAAGATAVVRLAFRGRIEASVT